MRILYLPNEYSQQRQKEKKANIYPVRMAMEAEWYCKQGHEVYWCPEWYGKLKDFADKIGGKLYIDKTISEPESLPFLTLPRPDRVFTRAKDYTSGNYKYLPGTHIMSASGCWWGKCSFCVEQGKPYEVRPVEDVVSEIEECVSLGFKEVFDDSASFPMGAWQSIFCARIISKQLKVTLGCNMRMVDNDYEFMKSAGFRMVLFGLESANQHTLDMVNKGVKVEDVKYIIKAAKAKLDVHVAVMFGYPWESDADAERTLKLVHFLLKKGYAKTAQASFYTPKNGCGNELQRPFIRKIYNVAYSPEFWFNQLKDIRNIDDIKYLWKKIKSGLGEKCQKQA